MDLRNLLLMSLFVLAFAAPATAQEPQVDPGSPAGIEYQLPVDRARDEAGGSSRSGRDSREAPLFGAGVESKKRSASAARSGTDSDPSTTGDGERDDDAGTTEAVRAQVAAPDRPGNALALIGAGACAVLLLGGLAGLAWRRSSPQA